VIDRDRKRGADRALARYLAAKAAVPARRRPAGRGKPLMVIPEMPEAMKTARRMGISF
jgi:hypothetical protein